MRSTKGKQKLSTRVAQATTAPAVSSAAKKAQTSAATTTPHSIASSSSSDPMAPADSMGSPKAGSASADTSSCSDSASSSSSDSSPQVDPAWAEGGITLYAVPPGVPHEQRWHRQHDYQDTKRQVQAMIRSGKAGPIIKTKVGIDGTHYQVQVPVSQSWPTIEIYPDPTELDCKELYFVETALFKLRPLLLARLVEKAKEFEEYHGRPVIVNGPRGEKIALVGPNYDGTVPTTSNSGLSSTSPQQQVQPSLNRNQRRAGKTRSQKGAA